MNIKKTGQVTKHLATRIKTLPLEVIFIVIFVIFGIIFTVIIPPGWNTDETNHAFRIYQLSKGDILSERTVDSQTGLRAYGGNVSTGLLKLFNETGAQEPGAPPNPARKIQGHLYSSRPQLTKIKDNGQQTSMNFSGAALYSPVTYAIYIPIFWLGQLISLPFFWIIIICRLMGIALSGAALFYAIRYAPFGKWIFFTVGLMPAIVVQASTVGADAPQLALSVLFVAYLSKVLFSKRPLNLLNYAIFVLLGAALVLVKFVYAPVLLLLFALIVMRKEARNWKTILSLTLAVTIALIPGAVWVHIVSYIDINSNPQADFAAQKLFIVHQPITYAKTLYYTFFTNTQTALANLPGSFIWDSVALPAIYVYVSLAALASSLFVQSPRELPLSTSAKRSYKVWRLALIGASLVTAACIATALYVYSTTYRQSSIIGIQARYFLPLLPLALLALYGNSAKNQRVVKQSILAMSLVVLIGTALVIYFRLYQVPALIVS